MRGLAAAVLGLGLSLASPVSVRAAALPFEGTGHAPAPAEGKAEARRHALLRARTAALEAALATIVGPVDAAGRASVLAQVEMWTGAYRIVEEKDDGATFTIKVEVDLDLGRLRKRVTRSEPAGAAAGLRLGEVRGSGDCAGLSRERVAETLRGFGVVRETAGGAAIRVEVACRQLGSVMFTHHVAARADVVARREDAALARAAAPGFSSSGSAAIEVAVEAALVALAEALSLHAAGGVTLVVEQPWPAARLRRLEAGLREAVLGVTGVELRGVHTDGSVRMHVAGDLDAAGLAARLRTLELPGFALEAFRVDSSAHELTVRIVD